MRSIVLAAVFSLMGVAAHATPTLVDFATVSMTTLGEPRTVTDTVCASDGNDLVCDRGVYVTPAGRVGIGISTPNAVLQVSGAVAVSMSSIYLDNGNGLVSKEGARISTGIGGRTWQVFAASGSTAGVAAFAVNGIDDTIRRVVVFDDPSATVGINTYFPNTALSVNGSVQIGYGLETCDVSRTGAIRYTGSDFSFCRNGSAWETLTSLGGGGTASPTNVPAFRVTRATNQAVSGPADVLIQFNTKEFDTLGDFNTGSYQFKPTIPGRYLITLSTRCVAGNGGCHAGIRKNGSVISYGDVGTYSLATMIIDMNGTTDYIDGVVYVGPFSETLEAPISRMSGSLLASGNGLISGSTALGDRITSGTSAVTMNGATGIVSITQLGAVASYIHPSMGYVGPGVSATGTVSGSKVATNVLKLSGATGSCTTAADEGAFFYDTARRRLQVCSLRN